MGREGSLRLVKSLGEGENLIGLVTQRDARVDKPEPADLHQVGTVAVVHKVVTMPNQTLFVLVEGLQRMRLQEVVQHEPFLRARIEPLSDVFPSEQGAEFQALVRNVRELFQKLSPRCRSSLRSCRTWRWISAMPPNCQTSCRRRCRYSPLALGKSCWKRWT